MEGRKATCCALATGAGIMLLAGCSGPVGTPRALPRQSGRLQAPIALLHMLSRRQGWALTANRHVLRTTKGVGRWQDVTPAALLPHAPGPLRQPVLPPAPPSVQESAYFLNRRDAWVAETVPGQTASATASVTVCVTTNGGGSWRTSSLALPPQYADAEMSFVNPRDGWLLATSFPALVTMSKRLYRTTDGGRTWTLVAGTGKGSLPLAGFLTGMRFRNSLDGWITGTGGEGPGTSPWLYATRNGGRTWRQQLLSPAVGIRGTAYANPFPPVFFGRDGVMPVHWMSANPAEYVLYVTHDGGGHWLPTTPFRLANGSDPLSFSFVNPQVGWIIGAGGSMVYRTGTGGRTWEALAPHGILGFFWPGPSSRERTSTLDFVSPRLGWAVTRISWWTAAGALRQAYRLFETRDGGRTWSRVSYRVQ